MKRVWNKPVIEIVATAETKFNTNGNSGDNGYTHVAIVDADNNITLTSVGPDTN